MFVWAVLLALPGCRSPRDLGPNRLPLTPAEPGYDWQLPPGFPPPTVPADNPMSIEKVDLGRRLFYDRRLSGNQTASCASCHRPELAFTDGRARAVGSTGEEHPRSAMSLVNVAYSPTFNWADPALTELEEQIEVPMFNRDPVELGLAGREREVEERLRADPHTRRRFREAFPGSHRPVTLANASKAIASFVRTILSADSAWDRYVFYDDSEALSTAAKRGMELFFSERTHCSECHRAPLFSGGMRVTGGMSAADRDRERVRARFHNTGLDDLDGEGAYPDDNQGLIQHTGEASDMGRFKAPTLRNVDLTAPYMHDGSIETLEEVIDFYAAGGRGRGRDNPYKDPLISGFEISKSENADLVEFLKALTDCSVTENPAFGPPGSTQSR